MAYSWAAKDIKFEDHPKFSGVKIAVLVDSAKTDRMSVSILKIAPGVEIPVHTHDVQLDSIYVVEGHGEALVNGNWIPVGPGDYILVLPQEEHAVRNNGGQELMLFIVHSPPLF